MSPPGRPPSRGDSATIGGRLRIARTRCGLSLIQAEEKAGRKLRAGTICTWETGRVPITAANLVKLARLYDCSSAWLLTGTAAMPTVGAVLLENVFAYLASHTAGELAELAYRATQAAEYPLADAGVSL